MAYLLMGWVVAVLILIILVGVEETSGRLVPKYLEVSFYTLFFPLVILIWIYEKYDKMRDEQDAIKREKEG